MSTDHEPKLHPSWLRDVVTAAKQEVDAWPEWKKPSSVVRRQDESERQNTVRREPQSE